MYGRRVVEDLGYCIIFVCYGGVEESEEGVCTRREEDRVMRRVEAESGDCVIMRVGVCPESSGRRADVPDCGQKAAICDRI